MPRWQAEIEAVGWSIDRMTADVEEAARERTLPKPKLSPVELRTLAQEALAAEGTLAARKIFTRRDVIVAVAPHLDGRNPGELTRAVDRTLADPEAVPLLPWPMGSRASSSMM